MRSEDWHREQHDRQRDTDQGAAATARHLRREREMNRELGGNGPRLEEPSKWKGNEDAR